MRFLDLARQNQRLDSGLTQILENGVHLTEVMPMAFRRVLGEIGSGEAMEAHRVHTATPTRSRRSDLLGEIAVACDQTQQF